MEVDEEKECAPGRSRLMRCISQIFPFGNDERLHFRRDLIAALSDESEHEKSEQEQFWYVPIPVDLSDVPWLIHDYGEPGIRNRSQMFPNCHCKMRKRRNHRNMTLDSSEIRFTHSTPIPGHSKTRHKSIAKTCCCATSGMQGGLSQPESGYSTACVSGRSTSSHSPVKMQADESLEASTKISALEEELKRLQQQIAVLVVTQEQMAKKQWVPGDTLPLDNDVPPPPPPPPPMAAPPPPPPPPPPAPMMVGRQKSVQEIIAERKKEKGLVIDKPKTNQPKEIDMSAVLKDIGKVKLKSSSLAKSPGGTPIREKPKPNPNDAASLIQNALKRKFSFARVYDSPEKENVPESPNHSNTSWSETPPGPHLLRSVRDRPRHDRPKVARTLIDSNA